MADSNPKFDRKAFKEALAMVESSGGKFLENSTSSAVGRYQFLWKNIKSDPQLKGVTRRQFINSRELQEKVMDMALDGKLKSYPNYIANAQKLQKEFNSDLRVDEIALLTHFLGAGGVRAQLRTGDYKVPGVNSSVKDYTGKYNKYLSEIKGDASLNTTQPTQEVAQEASSLPSQPQSDYEKQAMSIGMDNVPYADEPQPNSFSGADARPVENRTLGMQETIDIQQPVPEQYFPENNKIQYDNGRSGRLKNLLNMDDSGYNSKFKNIEDPTDNIVDNQNQMYGGGILGGPGTDPVKGKTKTTTTTGAPVRTQSITPITGPNGQIGSRREVQTTVNSNNRMDTPYTQSGNDAYAALDQSGRNAQDAAWNEIQNRNNSNTQTEVDETYSLNFEPQGIKFNDRMGPSTPEIQIQPQQKRMYHVAGSNMHNKNFGGHSQSTITRDDKIIPNASYTTQPGNPLSGRSNQSNITELTQLQMDGANTSYGKSWTKPIPDDTANEMLRRDQANLDTIVNRNTSVYNKQQEARKRTIANREANAAQRSQNQMAYGGPGDAGGDNELIEFEGGGTHEQNPLGGIPQGMGSNGKLNTVEEGESKISIDGEEYIFSQRGRLDGSGFDTPKQTNKYAMGGAIDPMTGMPLNAPPVGAGAGGGAGAGVTGAALGAVQMGLELIPDKGDGENQTGIEGVQQAGDVGLATAKGAASGAAMGAVAGPWGMAAGAVVGGAVAAIGSSAKNKKIKEENRVAYAQANPALQNQNYGGGYMKNKKNTKKNRVKAFLRK